MYSRLKLFFATLPQALPELFEKSNYSGNPDFQVHLLPE